VYEEPKKDLTWFFGLYFGYLDLIRLNFSSFHPIKYISINCSYISNFKRYASPRDGWIEEAYVSFEEGYGSITLAEAMIESVHRFSKLPVLVFIMGEFTASNWSPDRFPQVYLPIRMFCECPWPTDLVLS
jgi:hypothetical protein